CASSLQSSFGLPVLELEGEEDREADRQRQVGVDGRVIEPGIRIVSRGAEGDRRALRLLEEEGIARLEADGEEAREEDAEADTEVEAEVRVEVGEGALRIEDRDGARAEDTDAAVEIGISLEDQFIERRKLSVE